MKPLRYLRLYKGANDWNRVKTKEELLELLKEYKGILTKPILSYLNSLIELEFSVIREYISDSDRKVLAELEIYKKVAIYNIYNRTQNLFNQQNGEFIISGNDDEIEGLNVSIELNNRDVELFDFDYEEIHSSEYRAPQIPSDFKTMKIGDISLYQKLESKEQQEAELNRIMKILETLYDEKNPYSSRPGVVGGPGITWELDHARKIQEYEKRFKQLDSKKELSDDDKKEIEITNRIHDLILEDFGLTNKSFVDESNKFGIDHEETKLKKRLVKRLPNLTITDHINYI